MPMKIGAIFSTIVLYLNLVITDTMFINSTYIQDNLSPTIFSIMTFNTWSAGANVVDGLQKIVKHIIHVNPDIIALQETQSFIAELIRNQLNSYIPPNLKQDPFSQWRRCQYNYFGQIQIITRFPISMHYTPSDKLQNTGCRIQVRQIPAIFVDVWNAHLHWMDYGPYAVCIESNIGAAREILLKKEHQPDGRFYNILNLFKHEPFANQLASANLMLLVGDFNAPSHLDWIDSTTAAHCNVSFQWPVSMFLAAYGFRDSYRFVNANPAAMPGNTWSPVYKQHVTDSNVITGQNEPQDRIDFVYYRGSNLKPISSRIYEGYMSVRAYPNHRQNDWPSDHAAVITDFVVINY